MGDRAHRFTHGGIAGASIQVLEAEQWDLNRMLPESLHLPTADSMVTYTYACATLNLKGHHVMVDAGYHANEALDALALLSITPEDIEMVLITHGDGDHVAGLLTHGEALTFPNARFVLHRQLWDYWHSESARTDMTEEKWAFCKRLTSLIEDRVAVLSEVCEVEDGIHFIPSLGHRHGHAVYEFQTQTTPILHSGDTLFHPLFVDNPSWPDIMALDSEQEVASRRRLLERAAVSETLILTGHMPFPGMGFVERCGDDYRWQPADKGDNCGSHHQNCRRQAASV